jgi:hypothetical protein
MMECTEGRGMEVKEAYECSDGILERMKLLKLRMRLTLCYQVKLYLATYEGSYRVFEIWSTQRSVKRISVTLHQLSTTCTFDTSITETSNLRIFSYQTMALSR